MEEVLAKRNYNLSPMMRADKLAHFFQQRFIIIKECDAPMHIKERDFQHITRVVVLCKFKLIGLNALFNRSDELFWVKVINALLNPSLDDLAISRYLYGRSMSGKSFISAGVKSQSIRECFKAPSIELSLERGVSHGFFKKTLKICIVDLTAGKTTALHLATLFLYVYRNSIAHLPTSILI